MPHLLIRWIIGSLAIWFTTFIIPGLHIKGLGTILLTALVLGIVNAIVRPLFVLFTLPVTIITLGLFLFIINGLLLYLVAALVPNFKIDGFWWAVLGSLVITIISAILNMIFKA
jgi:putative membrane protein